MIYLESEVGQLERKLNEAAARIAYLEQQAFAERDGLCDRIEDLERKLKSLDHAFNEHVKRDLWRNFVADRPFWVGECESLRVQKGCPLPVMNAWT